MRIVLRAPPAGVAFSLPAKDGTAVRLVSDGGDLVFDFALEARPGEGGAPRFYGRFAHGPPARRFVYVGAGTFAGQPDSRWSRRAKVPLAGIDWVAIERAALAGPLVAAIRGSAGDGGPCCATVPLLGEGWAPRSISIPR